MVGTVHLQGVSVQTDEALLYLPLPGTGTVCCVGLGAVCVCGSKCSVLCGYGYSVVGTVHLQGVSVQTDEALLYLLLPGTGTVCCVGLGTVCV